MASALRNKDHPDEGVKEEEWELLSESRLNSLTSNTKEDVNKAAVEDVTQDKDSEDWYKTIPATPANTPEFTPLPPPYPSFNIRKPELQKSSEGADLPPIKEDVAEDHNHSSGDPKPIKTDLNETSSDEDKDNYVSQPLSLINSGVFRLVVNILMLCILKWILSRIWQKYKNSRSKGNSESKQVITTKIV